MAKLDFLDISYESYRNYHCGIPSTEKEKGLPFIVFTKIAIALTQTCELHQSTESKARKRDSYR